MAMTDARETIRRGVEALAKMRRPDYIWYGSESHDVADAFEAALKILRGEDAEANARLDRRLVTSTWGDHGPEPGELLRAAGGEEQQ